MSVQAMKQALEFIEVGSAKYAVAVLRAAIETAEKQEPVAIVGELCDLSRADAIRRGYTVGQYLYTTPQPAIPEGYLIPEKVPYKPFQSAFEDGYDNGWNDCIDDMLAAAPKEMK